AFVQRRMDREGDTYRSTIWIVDTVDIARSEPLPYTGGPREDTHPRWSPDSAWLAFLSNRDHDKKQVWILPAAGGEARRLTQQPEGVQSFVWAPDSTRLAFVSRVGVGGNGNAESRAPTRFIT